MLSRDVFDAIRGDVLELARFEERVAELEEACGPRCASTEPGGGGARAQLSPADRVVDAERERDVMVAQLRGQLDWACAILYGSSGRGGVAKARGSAAADSIHGYYLQGMSWPEVAAELVRPESKDGAQWCRRAAMRALEYIDAVGTDSLVCS